MCKIKRASQRNAGYNVSSAYFCSLAPWWWDTQLLTILQDHSHQTWHEYSRRKSKYSRVLLSHQKWIIRVWQYTSNALLCLHYYIPLAVCPKCSPVSIDQRSVIGETIDKDVMKKKHCYYFTTPKKGKKTAFIFQPIQSWLLMFYFDWSVFI